MHFYRNILTFLAVLLVLSLLPLIGDYYLLHHYEDTVPLFTVPFLERYAEVIPYNRTLSLVLYYLLIVVLMRMPSYQGPKRAAGQLSGKVQGGALLLFLLSGGCFIFFDSLGLEMYPLYPLLFVVALISLPLAKMLFPQRNVPHVSLVRRKRVKCPDSICLETLNSGWVNVVEPFRHTLIIGGSGSGKSESLVRPLMKAFIEEGFCGIVYDYKAPTLINEMNTLLIQQESRYHYPYYIINFSNVKASHRFNILHPDLIMNANYAEEYALSIISNLNRGANKNSGEFFTRSAINYLAAIIWFLKKRHPQYCTLPHALNIALFKDFSHVFSMLMVEPLCADRVMSIVTSLEQQAERQLAGQMGTIQNQLTTINTPEVAWILSGNDFIPNINDPEDPKLLAIGNDRQTPLALAPVISLIFTAALKTMNAEGKHKSFVLLDEGPTLKIPNLDTISAVSRSNKMALVYIAQDLSMMHDQYGREKTNTIISNMSNQFFGRVNLPETARMISDMIGKEERELISLSEGVSGSASRSNVNRNYSLSVQERVIVKPEEIRNLRRGEFLGNTTDEGQTYFWGRFKHNPFKVFYKVEDFIAFIDSDTGQGVSDLNRFLEEHLQHIKIEVEAIINSYPNIYHKVEESESTNQT
ncbi:type IV secretory system conjugative DNA transfer family protein [Cesiribacter sp. SM1]|uniref:type IV secretory system conjugative DNA transfer family protein n=1 Tax=Cesiribacter sp. SM1 TaxID=2861196 RepID=UPI001CD4D3F5|nr:type IV secretory system conjugative DNA transfer family protein [Cesiribacter sp. SM1]